MVHGRKMYSHATVLRVPVIKLMIACIDFAFGRSPDRPSFPDYFRLAGRESRKGRSKILALSFCLRDRRTALHLRRSFKRLSREEQLHLYFTQKLASIQVFCCKKYINIFVRIVNSPVFALFVWENRLFSAICKLFLRISFFRISQRAVKIV